MSDRSRSRSRDRSAPSGATESTDNGFTSVYISNLPFNVTDKELRENFDKFGHIEDLECIRDPKTQQSRGFAFIRYENSQDGLKAIEEMDQKQVFGRTLKVQQSKRGQGYEKTPGQYMGPAHKQLFGKGGRLSRDSRNGRDRDFGDRDRDFRDRERNRDRDFRDRDREFRDRDRDRDRDRGTGGRYEGRGGRDPSPRRGYDDRSRGWDRERQQQPPPRYSDRGDYRAPPGGRFREDARDFRGGGNGDFDRRGSRPPPSRARDAWGDGGEPVNLYDSIVRDNRRR